MEVVVEVAVEVAVERLGVEGEVEDEAEVWEAEAWVVEEACQNVEEGVE